MNSFRELKIILTQDDNSLFEHKTINADLDKGLIMFT